MNPDEDEAPPHLLTALTANSEDFDALATEWEALARETDALPFFWPQWHQVWLRHFGGDVSPVWLAFRDEEQEGKLVAVAPLDLAYGAARELGDPDVRDYGGPLVAPGWERPVAHVLLEWLQEDATPRLDLWGLHAEGTLAAAIREAATFWGWSLVEEPEAIAPAAALSGDFEAYVQALSKHDRHEYRRKWRKLCEGREVAFALETEPAAIAAGLPDLLRQMRASRAAKDAFLTPEMEAFFNDLAVTFAEAGLARLGRFTVDGALTATLLCFETESTLALYNSGFEPELHDLAVGLLSKGEALRWATDHGKRAFDFLRGDEEYKRRLGGVPVPLVKMTLSV
ncbi:MAG: GNAT family N-acetyltransferase [Dehalococcoidia bacterium]